MKIVALALLSFLILLTNGQVPNYLFQNITLGHNSKFSHIFLPEFASTSFEPEVTDYTVWVAPYRPIYSLDGSIELCQDAQTKLRNAEPQTFNNSNIPNFCEKYLCSQTKPSFLTQAQNTSLGSFERKNFEQLHILVNRICLQCEITIPQNFTNGTCPWVEKNYCLCTSTSQCIYYKPNFNLCYDWASKVFYHRDDFSHKVLFWLYMVYATIYLLISSVFLSILNCFCLILPEIFKLFKNFTTTENNWTWKDKVRALFSISNQIKLLITISLTLSFLMCVVDLIFPSFFIKPFIVPLNFGVFFVCFLLITVLWFHIIEEMKSFAKRKLSLRNTIFYFVSGVFIIFICFLELLFYVGYSYIDSFQRKIFIYFVGGWGFFFPLIGIVTPMMISLSAIIIVVRVYLNKTLREDYGGCCQIFIKLKFSRFMIFIDINMLVWALLAINTMFQFIIGKDYISNSWYMVSFPIYSVGISATIFIIMTGMFEFQYFKGMILATLRKCKIIKKSE
jgi:hypothetical protein